MRGCLCSASKEQKTGQTVTSDDIRQNVPFLPASLFCKPPASFDSSGGCWVSVCQWEREREKQREKEREREYSSFLPMTLFQQYWSPIGRQTGRKVQFLHQDWFHLKVSRLNASKVVEGRKCAERGENVTDNSAQGGKKMLRNSFWLLLNPRGSLRRVIWL